jgi:predicted nucleotidyltransferase component of viral defense system
MSNPDETIDYGIVDVDVRAWVDAVRADPTQHRDRQVAEIVLAAIGLAPNLKDTLILKGGAAMALAFKSNRQTGDIDFTSTIEPHGLAESIAAELDPLFTRAAINLGHLDLICRVQTIKKLPRPLNFEEHDFPALLVRIGSAKRGSKEEQKLADGIASRVLDLEISFRDQVYASQDLNLIGAGVAVRAFTMHELIAEKMRALLQQPIRKRNRRQDVYDIAYLIDDHDLSGADKAAILTTLVGKCRSRGIEAKQESMDDPEVKQRAAADWDTLALEVSDLPPFEERFTLMRDLYVSLPWAALRKPSSL